MVLNVTRLRRRGLTSRCETAGTAGFAPSAKVFSDPFLVPFWAPFWPLAGDPILEKQARIVAGGNPPRADSGYKPRSAMAIEEGSRSLPTICIEQSFAGWESSAGGRKT